MKKYVMYFIAVITVLFESCVSQKESTKTPVTPKTFETTLTPWTAKIQDSLKFSASQVKELTFYCNSTIRMEGGFFSITSFVEDGVAVIVDTTEQHSRTIDAWSEGKVTGIPQRDPGTWPFTSMHLIFQKGDMSFDFEFNLDANGNTVLNKDAEVMYQGKKYSIRAYALRDGQYQSQQCKLFINLKRKHVRIYDNQ